MKPTLTLIETHRPVILDYDRSPEPDYVWNDRLDGRARHIVIGDAECAMPTARAADASHSSLLRVSTGGGIAIAALCIIYFVAEFLR